jgi:hypothetical protein
MLAFQITASAHAGACAGSERPIRASAFGSCSSNGAAALNQPIGGMWPLVLMSGQ